MAAQNTPSCSIDNLNQRLEDGSIRWTHIQVTHLISLWEENLADLRRAKRHAIVYGNIAQQLEEEFSKTFTARNVKDKIANLRKQYRKNHASHGTTGSSPPTWEYYFLIHKFLCSLPVNDHSLRTQSSVFPEVPDEPEVIIAVEEADMEGCLENSIPVAPVQRVEAPVQRVEAPVQTVEAPVQTVEAPVQTVTEPVNSIDQDIVSSPCQTSTPIKKRKQSGNMERDRVSELEKKEFLLMKFKYWKDAEARKEEKEMRMLNEKREMEKIRMEKLEQLKLIYEERRIKEQEERRIREEEKDERRRMREEEREGKRKKEQDEREEQRKKEQDEREERRKKEQDEREERRMKVREEREERRKEIEEREDRRMREIEERIKYQEDKENRDELKKIERERRDESVIESTYSKIVKYFIPSGSSSSSSSDCSTKSSSEFSFQRSNSPLIESFEESSHLSMDNNSSSESFSSSSGSESFSSSSDSFGLMNINFELSNNCTNSSVFSISDISREDNMNSSDYSTDSNSNTNNTTFRSIWVKPASNDWYERIFPTLNGKDFRENFHVKRNTYIYLIDKLTPHLQKQDTKFRKSIPVNKRVAVSLYHLASCCELRVTAYMFGIGKSTVCNIVHEFVNVVNTHLKEEFIFFPNNEEKLKKVADNFRILHNMPQCVGAIDGCHIPVCPPKEDRIDYYNSKGWCSILLLAVVDANYRFTFINVGAPGRNNDSELLRTSPQLWKIVNSTLFDKIKTPVHGLDTPGYLLGDSAFPLMTHLLKPYPDINGQNEVRVHYNKRVCSTRRVVENVFGRLKARFRVVYKSMEGKITNIKETVSCCCILHNICEFVKDPIRQSWTDAVNDGIASNECSRPCNADNTAAKNFRDNFAEALYDHRLI